MSGLRGIVTLRSNDSIFCVDVVSTLSSQPWKSLSDVSISEGWAVWTSVLVDEEAELGLSSCSWALETCYDALCLVTLSVGSGAFGTRFGGIYR